MLMVNLPDLYDDITETTSFLLRSWSRMRVSLYSPSLSSASRALVVIVFRIVRRSERMQDVAATC
jgi:hypothetical protein